MVPYKPVTRGWDEAQIQQTSTSRRSGKKSTSHLLLCLLISISLINKLIVTKAV
jgi:hypothetical protein